MGIISGFLDNQDHFLLNVKNTDWEPVLTQQTVLSDAEAKKPAFFYGYIIVLSGLIIALVVWGSQYSYGVFFKPLLAEFGWTRAATSGAYSLNLVLQGVFGFIAGRLCDRFGPRGVVTICGVLLGVGYLLMSQVQAIWHIYLFFGILISAGTCGFVPIMSTAVRWFVKRRGLMSGIIMAGTGVGITAVPPLANMLIASYDWRTAYSIDVRGGPDSTTQTNVPYYDVYQDYRRSAEQAVGGEQYPPDERRRVKDYFDALDPAR